MYLGLFDVLCALYADTARRTAGRIMCHIGTISIYTYVSFWYMFISFDIFAHWHTVDGESATDSGASAADHEPHWQGGQVQQPQHADSGRLRSAHAGHIHYGVPTISRLLNIIGLFCRI